jgi:protein SCO1/2
MHIRSGRAVSAMVLTLALLAVLGVLSGCATVAGVIGGPTMTPIPPGGDPVSPPHPLPDFVLTNQDGDDVGLADLAGKPALFFFGYTHCPDVCPLTLAEMRQAATLLGERSQEVHFVFVSVDGQRDTPERLRQFLPQFGPYFLGLTTTNPDRLTAATAAFEVFYEIEEVPDTAAGYLVAHTASTFLVDARGRLTMRFAYRTPPAILADGILALLEAEQPG